MLSNSVTPACRLEEECAARGPEYSAAVLAEAQREQIRAATKDRGERGLPFFASVREGKKEFRSSEILLILSKKS